MSIFVLATIGFLLMAITVMIGVYVALKKEDQHQELIKVIVSLISSILFVSVTFGGVALSDEYDRAYVCKYLEHKDQIEYELGRNDLTTQEKSALVALGTEKNEEFTARKEKFYRWHHFHYDNSIYDGIELIDVNGINE